MPKSDEKLKEFVESLGTYEFSILKYYMDISLDKRLIEKIIEASPKENKVIFNYPINVYPQDTAQIKYMYIVSVELAKFAEDNIMIVATDENGNGHALNTLFEWYTMEKCLETVEKMIDHEKEEKKSLIPIHFDNEDIIITDPCYIIKADTDDWRKCNYGNDMEALGFTNYKIRDTIYGDWSCTVFNTDTNEKIGEFCADAGMVGVFSLSEVLKYNPEFDYHLKRKWTTTLIESFTGDVWFEVEHHMGIYEDDSPIMEWTDDEHKETRQKVDSNGAPLYYHRKGDTWKEDSVHVIGKGNINFKSIQTGL
jgi:hypothetical protein